MNAITMQSAGVPQTVPLNVHVIKDSLEMDLLVKVPLLHGVCVEVGRGSSTHHSEQPCDQ